MADRGIEVVHAHLAKLPPAESLTVAERRAQYERAEKVFPVPPDVKVERVTAGRGAGGMAAPSVGEGGACRALSPRRRLRDRVAALPSPSGGGYRGGRGRQRAPARLPPGARASVPRGGRRRRGRVSLAPRPGHRGRAHRGRGRLGGRRPHGGRRCSRCGTPACPCRPPACAFRRGSISPVAARAISRRPPSIRSCAQAASRKWRARTSGSTDPRIAARLAALRRSPRPAARS